MDSSPMMMDINGGFVDEKLEIIRYKTESSDCETEMQSLPRPEIKDEPEYFDCREISMNLEDSVRIELEIDKSKSELLSEEYDIPFKSDTIVGDPPCAIKQPPKLLQKGVSKKIKKMYQLPRYTKNHTTTPSQTEHTPARTQVTPNCENVTSEIVQLKRLLESWNQEHILDHLIAEKVTIKVLKIIKRHHIERLLKHFDMGTQITFEHNLELWRQQDVNVPLDGFVSPACSEKSFASENRFSPYSTISPTPDSEATHVMLSDILNESAKAQILIDYYDKFKTFQDEQRNSLIHLIAHYFEDKGIPMPLATSFKLERQIIERFPTEKLDYYRTAKRGKIYNKWRNLSSHLKCTVNQIKPKTVTKGNNRELRFQEHIVPEEDAQSCIDTLKHRHLSSEEFDNVWKACSNLRLHQIKTFVTTTAVLDAWPFYRQPTGFRLIEMDFETAFKTKGRLVVDWKSECPAILSFLKDEQHVKDKNIKAMLDKLMTENDNQNGYDAALLWSLHGYMVPTNKIVKKDNTGKNTTTKFTIRDSQESFLFLGRTIQEVEDRIEFLKEKKKIVQPFVYCIGEDIFNIETVGLFFDDIRYQFFNVLRALDSCFKIIYLFNLQFPTESIMPWSFIEQYFFGFKTNHQYAKVHVLCEYLKNRKNKEN